MRRSVETSSFLKCRFETSVTERIEKMLKAIKTKDWSSFCDLTMADSNEMHAVALNTFPPCVYMNDTSHAIADFVHQYNAIKIKEEKEEQKICYTFDAGPNACLFIPGKVIEEVSILLPRCFPASNSNSVNISKNNPYWQGIPITNTNPSTLKILRKAFGEQASSRIRTFARFRRFKDSRGSVEDDKHSGRPLSCTTS
ncbi:Diphosphomevalonate decarboxylase [Armadillidium nasatum]|uniref:Diphosphomevalonate decarboxylase n=1 Tax=Armadillidium nasatum TaxID=96803 RepID=A0A5N5T6V6_9CRUS|nr:Diphosphomevalonate decarboxylase [Armadillidium nasatum]